MSTPARKIDALELVRRAFHKAFGTPPEHVQPTSSPDDIEGWDSLGHVNLVRCLEEGAGIQLEVDEIMEMEDVQAILRVLENHVAK